MIRIGIVDDHPAVRDGLVASLTRHGEPVVRWSSGTVASARVAVATEPCDVVLVDVRLPDGPGSIWCRRVGEAAPQYLVLSSL
jgi:DNA-binding NarL/FixJ family response regulator